MSLALTTTDNLNCVTFEPAHPCRWGHGRRRQVEERGQLINLRKEAHAVGNQHLTSQPYLAHHERT